MSVFDEVMAETWEADRCWVDHGPIGMISTSPLNDASDDPKEEMRAAILVLGKRALGVLLKHEWVEHTGMTDDRIDVFRCPSCDGWRPEHHPACALGAIVAEAKRLGLSEAK